MSSDFSQTLESIKSQNRERPQENEINKDFDLRQFGDENQTNQFDLEPLQEYPEQEQSESDYGDSDKQVLFQNEKLNKGLEHVKKKSDLGVSKESNVQFESFDEFDNQKTCLLYTSPSPRD